MKSILFLTILFYECNNQIFATLEALPSSLEIASKTNQNPDPISAIDIDYLKNGLVFQFRRNLRDDNSDIETRRRSALDKNFMRFGRGDKSLMRFGRSGTSSNLKSVNSRSGNNLMRFGRNSNNRMRFGKRDNNNKNLMRFGRVDNRLRLGRRSNDLMRFGRSGGNEHLDNLERLWQKSEQGHGKNLLIFGSLDKNPINFEKIGHEQEENISPSLISSPISTEAVTQFLNNNYTDTSFDQQSSFQAPLKILYDESGQQSPILVRQFNSEKSEEDPDGNSNENNNDDTSYY